MSGEHFEPGRDGVNGGVGKLVTIRGSTYLLAELLRQGEGETDYAAVNTATGLRRFVIKLYPPGCSEQQIQEDAEQRLVSSLTLRALGLPVLRADVVPSSCGPVRLMRCIMGERDDTVECAELLDRAQAAYEREEFRSAIATCEAITAINPRHTDAMAIRAQCLIATSDPDGALQLMLEVVELETNDELFNRIVAECALASGYSHVAISLLFEQINVAPGDIAAAERLVEILLHELLVDAADQVVKRYRDRLSSEAGAHYFATYDASAGLMRDRADAVRDIVQMQQNDAWKTARDAWQPLVDMAIGIAYLNRETCRYHLGEALDLRGLLQLAQRSNPMIRSVAWTLVLLGSARQNELPLAVIAARSTKESFPEYMDLCGVPIWTLWDRQVSGRPEPIVAALRALAAVAKGDERELFTWMGQHYGRYANQIGAIDRVLSVAKS